MITATKTQFRSQGIKCCALTYRAESHNAQHWVIMAHGLGGIKEMRLDAYAEHFVEAGYNVLIFDYRHFGESDGEPRQLLSIKKQHQDWLAAIQFVKSEYQVPLQNIFIWGSSLSGGHVFEIASQVSGLGGVISQVPHVSSFASIKSNSLLKGAKLTLLGLTDFLRNVLGLSPIYIKVCAQPGDVAILTGVGDYDGYYNIVPHNMDFDNRIAARFALEICSYSPGKKIASLRMPTLLQLGLKDITTPGGPAITACKKSSCVDLKTYDADHFAPYVDPLFGTIIKDQISFLNQATKSS